MLYFVCSYYDFGILLKSTISVVADPKSHIFIFLSLPIITFYILISRWTNPALCRTQRPWSIELAIPRTVY